MAAINVIQLKMKSSVFKCSTEHPFFWGGRGTKLYPLTYFGFRFLKLKHKLKSCITTKHGGTRL